MYDKTFYNNNARWGVQSAEVIVPIILNFFKINSLVDFGCGTGAWLSIFKKHGVKKIKGYDGEYVLQNDLLINDDEFTPCDLRTLNFIDNKYDLAISLEVGEHIEKEFSEHYIRQITKSSDTVLFSAAIPGQGGVGHVNEQWLSYWVKIFIQFGYIPLDMIRPQLWEYENVRTYYKQNLMIFTKNPHYIEKYGKYISMSPHQYMIWDNVDFLIGEKKRIIERYRRKYIILSILNEVARDNSAKKLLGNITRKVAIYGMGDIGIKLLEVIKDSYEVVKIYDSNNVDYEKYKFEECEYDTVIVTPVFGIDSFIVEDMMNKGVVVRYLFDIALDYKDNSERGE